MKPFCVVVCFEDASRRRFVLVRNRRRGWELPGGWIEDGEDPLEAGRREFEEETGRALGDARRVELSPGAPWTALVTGLLGPPGRKAEGDVVVEWRLVQSLRDAPGLSFPDDPYHLIGSALDRRL